MCEGYKQRIKQSTTIRHRELVIADTEHPPSRVICRHDEESPVAKQWAATPTPK
jgi:hypothetical protein